MALATFDGGEHRVTENSRTKLLNDEHINLGPNDVYVPKRYKGDKRGIRRHYRNPRRAT